MGQPKLVMAQDIVVPQHVTPVMTVGAMGKPLVLCYFLLGDIAMKSVRHHTTGAPSVQQLGNRFIKGDGPQCRDCNGSHSTAGNTMLSSLNQLEVTSLNSDD